MADIMMKKIYALNMMGYPSIVAIHKGEKELYKKAKEYGLPIKDRNKKSVTTATKCNDVCHFLKDFEFSHCLWLNSSAPFFKINTIEDIISLFQSYNEIQSIHLIEQVKNWFWDGDFKPINMVKTCTRTQESGLIYKSIHTMHLFNREYMLKTGSYWSLKENDPYFMVVYSDNFEYLDVDTKEDFKVCELIWKEKEKDLQQNL